MTESGFFLLKQSKQLFSLAFLALLAVWVVLDVSETSSEKCEMTYMYPNYFRIALFPAEIKEIMSRTVREDGLVVGKGEYGLFLYREGWKRPLIRDALRELSGIPVLFIPGNGGSFKQVRSLASESHRIFLSSRPEAEDFLEVPLTTRESIISGAIDMNMGGEEFNGNQSQFRSLSQFGNHLDWFMVDFMEDLSAFDTRIIHKQVDFLVLCIGKILELYKEVYLASESGQKVSPAQASLPSSVILVGHSMGGLLARAVALHPRLNSSSVHTILTLATPHQALPLSLQPSLHQWLSGLNHDWRRDYAACLSSSECRLGNTVVVSVDGGPSDMQVRSAASQLSGLSPPGRHVSVSSPGVPGVWVSPDHQSIVWCNQLVKRLVVSLLLMVDARSGQLLHSAEARMSVLTARLRSPLSQAAAAQAACKEQAVPQRGFSCPARSEPWIVEPQDTDIIVESRLLTVVDRDGRRRWMDIQEMRSKGHSHFALVTNLKPCSEIRVHLWKQGEKSQGRGRRTVEVTRRLMQLPVQPERSHADLASFLADHELYPKGYLPGLSSVLLLTSGEMTGYRFITVSVAPKELVARDWSEQAAHSLHPANHSMLMAQFYSHSVVPVSLHWWLLATVVKPRTLVVEEGHPLVVPLSLPLSPAFLPLLLSITPGACGGRVDRAYVHDPQVKVQGDAAENRASAESEETAASAVSGRHRGSCLFGCFPALVMAWAGHGMQGQGFSQEVIMPLSKPAGLEGERQKRHVDARGGALLLEMDPPATPASAPWLLRNGNWLSAMDPHLGAEGVQHCKPGNMLLILDPHCEFRVSIKAPLRHALLKLLVSSPAQAMVFLVVVLLLSLSLQLHWPWPLAVGSAATVQPPLARCVVSVAWLPVVLAPLLCLLNLSLSGCLRGDGSWSEPWCSSDYQAYVTLTQLLSFALATVSLLLAVAAVEALFGTGLWLSRLLHGPLHSSASPLRLQRLLEWNSCAPAAACSASHFHTGVAWFAALLVCVFLHPALATLLLLLADSVQALSALRSCQPLSVDTTSCAVFDAPCRRALSSYRSALSLFVAHATLFAFQLPSLVAGVKNPAYLGSFWPAVDLLPTFGVIFHYFMAGSQLVACIGADGVSLPARGGASAMRIIALALLSFSPSIPASTAFVCLGLVFLVLGVLESCNSRVGILQEEHRLKAN